MKIMKAVCVLALVACAAGSVPSSFADEEENLYENSPSDVDMHVVQEKRGRGLDPMAGITFGSIKKRIDSLSGASFGAQKRSEKEPQLHDFLSSHRFDRRDKESASTFQGKKLPLAPPYPYMVGYAPVIYKVKDRGM